MHQPPPTGPAAWTVTTRPTRRRLPRRFVPPETRYARRDDISIAYQVLGDGHLHHIVLADGLMAHMDLLWAEPGSAAALRQLSSNARLILFDKPGTGLSDPVFGAPSNEQRRSTSER